MNVDKYPAFFHLPFINVRRENKIAKRTIVTSINVSVFQRAEDLC